MRYLRSILRLPATGLITVCFYLLFASVSWILPERTSLRWRNFCLTSWATVTTRLLGVRFEQTGVPPRPPFFLVSNHISYLDILVLYRFLNCTFVSRGDVKRWPVIGWMARSLGILFIDREKRKDVIRVNRLIEHAMTPSQGVILFPEGTTSEGDRILPFRSSLLNPPASREIPVHYAVLSYHTGVESSFRTRTIGWEEGDPFLTHMMKMTANRQMICRITFCEEPVLASDRKLLTGKLQEKIVQQFEKQQTDRSYRRPAKKSLRI